MRQNGTPGWRFPLAAVCLLVATMVLTLTAGPADSSTALAAEESTENQIRMLIKSSAQSVYETETKWTDKKLIRDLEAAQPSAAYEEALMPDAAIEYEREKGQRKLWAVTTAGEVIEPVSKMKMAVSERSREQLKQQVQSLRAQHYGEILPWPEASKALPKYSKFEIVDLESGLRFQGQRRAGSSHADVQPLTKEDSATLKQIYGGVWSWDRRAVLVKLNGRTLAGSMHGMPHGGDGIPGNDFNGHFCIHFLGSSTHGSRSVDPAHQVMVHRAAGLLNEYVGKLTPWQLIDVWIAGANQGDLQLLQAATGQQQAVHVRSMRRLSKSEEPDTSRLLKLETAVDVTVTPDNSTAPRKRRVLFRLERVSPDARWYIRSAQIT